MGLLDEYVLRCNANTPTVYSYPLARCHQDFIRQPWWWRQQASLTSAPTRRHLTEGSTRRRQDHENLKSHIRMKSWNIFNALTWR